jgi:hypothetical protein
MKLGPLGKPMPPVIVHMQKLLSLDVWAGFRFALRHYRVSKTQNADETVFPLEILSDVLYQTSQEYR